MMEYALIGVIVLFVLEVLAAVWLVIRINLPAWRETPGKFRKDLKETLYCSYMIWLFLGWVPTIFLFFVPATQAEFNVGVYYTFAYALSCAPLMALA